MEEQKIEKKSEKNIGALFIPAGLFIGFGVGFLIDSLPAGIFLGLGAGFAVFAISLFFKK